jgi:hypothetical protein
MRRSSGRAFSVAVALILMYGCGPAVVGDPGASVGPGVTVTDTATGTRAAAGGRMVPAGHGSLRQDDITISLRSGAVLLKVTPLDEATIRLLAPDTYTRLSALRDSRRPDQPHAGARPPEFFLVSFFSYEPDQIFQPENVQLVYQSRLLQPVTIMPLTGGWGRQRLGQQETQSAIFAFDGPIDFEQNFTVRYDLVESSDWHRIVPLLETERARVITRSGSPG